MCMNVCMCCVRRYAIAWVFKRLRHERLPAKYCAGDESLFKGGAVAAHREALARGWSHRLLHGEHGPKKVDGMIFALGHLRPVFDEHIAAFGGNECRSLSSAIVAALGNFAQSPAAADAARTNEWYESMVLRYGAPADPSPLQINKRTLTAMRDQIYLHRQSIS